MTVISSLSMVWLYSDYLFHMHDLILADGVLYRMKPRVAGLLSVVTEEDWDDLSDADAKKWDGYTVSISSTTLDPDEDSAGAEDASGWEYDGDFLEEVLKSMESDAAWTSFDGSYVGSDPETDRGSGEVTTYSAHIERGDGKGLTSDEKKAIKKYLRIR